MSRFNELAGLTEGMRPDRVTKDSDGYTQEHKILRVDVDVHGQYDDIRIDLTRSGKLAWARLQYGRHVIGLAEDQYKEDARANIDKLIAGLKKAKKYLK
jgi:hypothetical protein